MRRLAGALTAMAVLATAGCGEDKPKALRFASEGDPCTSSETLYLAPTLPSPTLTCARTEYSGPLSLRDQELINIKFEKLATDGDGLTSDDKKTIEEYAQQFADARLESRRRCKEPIPTLKLSTEYVTLSREQVLTYPTAGPVRVTVSQSTAAMGVVTISWEVEVPEGYPLTGPIRAGFSKALARAARLDLSRGGRASRLFYVKRPSVPETGSIELELGVYFRAEGPCGTSAIGETSMLVPTTAY